MSIAGEGARLHQAVGDVVAVAEVGEPEARRAEPKCCCRVSRSASAWHGWCRSVSALIDRDRRRGGEPADVVVGEGADDEGAGVAAHDAGGVLDGLASAELELVGSDDLGDATEVGDGGAEGEPGPGRRLGEVGDDRVAAEQLGVAVRVAARTCSLSRSRCVEVVGAEVGDAEEVLHGGPSVQTGSRMRGQLMQRGPPRPRPSSLPAMVMTSMPALRSFVLVSTLRS